jgi:hypothetical protein
VSDASAQLDLLTRLLGIARPGAVFPDVRRVSEWLVLSQLGGRTAPKVELHPVSGFPTASSLQRLLERQAVARAWFEAHGAHPQRHAEQFNSALAAADLWAPSVTARLVSADRGLSRLLVVHDRFCAATGTLVRFSLQLTQRGTGHVHLEPEQRCTLTPAFTLAVDEACDSSATLAALRVGALEDLTVTEAVRGELGPCFTPHGASSGSLGELARSGSADDGILSVLLERVGQTVTADFQADLWPEPDPHVQQRRGRGWQLARERKLACTVALEAPLKLLTKGTRIVVRCR